MIHRKQPTHLCLTKSGKCITSKVDAQTFVQSQKTNSLDMSFVKQPNAEIRDEVFDQFKNFLIDAIAEIANSETRLSLASIQALLERGAFLDLSKEEVFDLISENFHRFQSQLNVESQIHHGLHQIKDLSDDQRVKLESKEALFYHINTPIGETGLPKDITDKLISSGVETVGDLADTSYEPLMYGCDMTREEIRRIKGLLGDRRLELNMRVNQCRKYRT